MMKRTSLRLLTAAAALAAAAPCIEFALDESREMRALREEVVVSSKIAKPALLGLGRVHPRPEAGREIERMPRRELPALPGTWAHVELGRAIELASAYARRGGREDLEWIARQPQDVRVRAYAVRALGARFGVASRSLLARLAEAPSEPWKLRSAAARALGDTGAGCEDVLIRILEFDEVQAVRSAATEGLARIGTARALGLVRSWGSESPAHAQAARRALRAARPTTDGALTLARIAADELGDEGLRLGALHAVKRRLTPEVVAQLARVARDAASAEIRTGALAALGWSETREARTAVAAAEADPHPEVARAARIAAARQGH